MDKDKLISFRLPAEMLRLVDAARGGLGRGAWLREVILDYLLSGGKRGE